MLGPEPHRTNGADGPHLGGGSKRKRAETRGGEGMGHRRNGMAITLRGIAVSDCQRMDTPEERAYRSAFRRVEALQIELARHVYSVQRRQDAERKLEEAMKALDTARRDLLKLRNRQKKDKRAAA